MVVDELILFKQRKKAMSDKKTLYSGESVDVEWDGRLCIHIGECGRAKNDLFVGGRKPWCQPDLTGVEDVAEVVERCPTGALSYNRKDGGAEETPAEKNTVVVSNNGPFYITGDLEIDGVGEDMPGVAFRAALCRCGLSNNKPFCDNAHEKASFLDRGAVGDDGAGFSEEGGKLSIRRVPNGPLMVKGNFSIVAGSGRLAWRGTKAALCRCGASKNKPFCDGAHRDMGFEAD